MSANLLIWNAAECIIGIFALQVNDQLRELVIVSEKIYRILCLKRRSVLQL
jgi:hypothetical protein